MSFYERFTDLCNKAGVSPASVANSIGLSNSSTTYWKRGSIPKSETMQKLAEYFGVSVDYLVGTADFPFPDLTGQTMTFVPVTETDIASLKFALFGGDSEEITDEDIEDVRQYAEFIKQRKKAKKVPPQD